MDITFAWWAWAAGALVLGILEVVAPGSIFLGFAIGAAVVALLLGVGGGAALVGGSLPWLLVIFAAVSLIAWVLMRRVFKLKSGGDVKVWTTDIND